MRKKSLKKGSSDMLVSVVGGAAAGLAAVAADKYLLKSVDPLYSGIGMVAVGAVLPAVVSMKGVNEAGAGLIAVGAEKIAGKYLNTPSVSGNISAYRKQRFSTIGSPARSATEFLANPINTVSGMKKKSELSVID